jgi:hypothetical protein
VDLRGVELRNSHRLEGGCLGGENCFLAGVLEGAVAGIDRGCPRRVCSAYFFLEEATNHRLFQVPEATTAITIAIHMRGHGVSTIRKKIHSHNSRYEGPYLKLLI